MKAMILAAGRGERMRPLTDTKPKPLICVNGKPLLEYHIERLVAAGIDELVINHAHMGEQIEAYFGDGRQFGARIYYSPEQDALETGGGIFNALHLLSGGPFIVVNADVWTEFPFETLKIEPESLAHLVLVPNPQFHRSGDFHLQSDGRNILPNADSSTQTLTFSGISLLSPSLFANSQAGAFPLAPLLRRAIAEGRVTGVSYPGIWSDVGTPKRLRELEDQLQSRGGG